MFNKNKHYPKDPLIPKQVTLFKKEYDDQKIQIESFFHKGTKAIDVMLVLKNAFMTNLNTTKTNPFFIFFILHIILSQTFNKIL